jgi:hypothetical protein
MLSLVARACHASLSFKLMVVICHICACYGIIQQVHACQLEFVTDMAGPTPYWIQRYNIAAKEQVSVCYI